MGKSVLASTAYSACKLVFLSYDKLYSNNNFLSPGKTMFPSPNHFSWATFLHAGHTSLNFIMNNISTVVNQNMLKRRLTLQKDGNQRMPALLGKQILYWTSKSDDIDWSKFLRHFHCEGKEAASYHKVHFEGVFVGSHCQCGLGKYPFLNLICSTDFWILVILVCRTCIGSPTFSVFISQPPWWRYPEKVSDGQCHGRKDTRTGCYW